MGSDNIINIKDDDQNRIVRPMRYRLWILRTYGLRDNIIGRHRSRKLNNKINKYSLETKIRTLGHLERDGLLRCTKISIGIDGSTKQYEITEKGMRALRNRRAEYNVEWWTDERDRMVTRALSIFASIISLIALIALIAR